MKLMIITNRLTWKNKIYKKINVKFMEIHVKKINILPDINI